MEVSKVTISQATRKRILETHHLTPKKRQELRIRGVKEYIKSKPNGELIQASELMKAAGYHFENYESKQYKAAANFIVGLRKRGIVIKKDPSAYKSEWYVPEETKEIMSQEKPNLITVKIPKMVKAEDVKENESAEGDKPSRDIEIQKYTFELTISKRSKADDYGKQTVAKMEMADITASTMNEMIEKLINNIN